jgi:hypothetical protein
MPSLLTRHSGWNKPAILVATGSHSDLTDRRRRPTLGANFPPLKLSRARTRRGSRAAYSEALPPKAVTISSVVTRRWSTIAPTRPSASRDSAYSTIR